MKPNLLLIISILLTLSSCSRKIYVVRHGEKDTSGTNAKDPQLSEAGKVRAIVLRDQLKGKDISYIFSTNTVRTVSTAKPLSDQTGISIQLYNTQDSLDYFINTVKAMKKGNVLIVGHSNTVDDVVNKLCGEVKITGDLPETEFDNLFIVKLKGKKARLTKMKYGYASNP